MWVVIEEGKVSEIELEEVRDFRIELQSRQGVRIAGELQSGLFEVIVVQVGIPQGVYKIAKFELRHLCDHHG